MENYRKLLWKADDEKEYMYEGIFHKWINKISKGSGNEVPYALIELSNGTMTLVHFHNVKFKEKP